MISSPSIDRKALKVIHCMRAQNCRRVYGGGFSEGPTAGLTAFWTAVDAGARRKLTFLMGSCSHATADEIALLHLLADAQHEKIDACGMRARWLGRGSHTQQIVDAALEAAAGLLEMGVELEPPTLPNAVTPVVLHTVSEEDSAEFQPEAQSVGV